MGLAENQRRTAEDLLQGYRDWTIEGLLRARSDDCVHHMLPASLNRPPRTNDDYREFFKPLSKMMDEFKMEILKIVNDPEQHMAVVHAKGSGETPVGPYRNEYAFFCYFNKDGTKVTRVEEFVDSAFSQGFFGKVGEYLRTKGQTTAWAAPRS